jgi:endosialidase-like protein
LSIKDTYLCVGLVNGVPTWTSTTTLSTISGTLTAGGGGTGISNPSAAGILLGSYAGGSWQQLATSSLGLLTTNVVEGSNLYYTANRVAGVIAGTTTTALAEGTNLYFTNARADARVAAGIAGTTTDAVAEGSNNKYFTNARADARINATTSIGTLTSAPSLSTLATSLTGFLKATAGVLSTALIDLTSSVTGILPVGNGGTGQSAIAANAIVIGNGGSGVSTTSAGTNGQVLALVNGIPSWVSTTTLSSISGTLGVGSGGTGANAFSYGLLLSPGGTSAVTNIATSSLGLLTTNVAEGSNLYWTNTRFDNRLSATTSLPNIITLANLASVGALTSGSIASGFGAINIGGNLLSAGNASLAAATTTALAVVGPSSFANSANFFGLTSFGATATTTIATNGTITTPSIVATNSGTFYGSTSFGSTATSSFSSAGILTLTNLNGPLQANAGIVSATTSIGALYGGTGQTSVTTGDILYGSAANAWSRLGIGTGGFVLGVSNGLPAWVATSTLSSISGTLGIANGGTNNTSAYTSGSVIYSDGSKLTQDNSNFFWDATNHRFGVGTTSPQGLLHVGSGSATLNSSIFVDGGTNSGRGGFIQFNRGDVPTSYLGDTSAVEGGTSNDLTLAASTNNNIRFYGGTAGATEVMRIQNGGNVGIGTTSPVSLLNIENTAPAFTLNRSGSGTGNAIIDFRQDNTNKAYLALAGTNDQYVTGSLSGNLVMRSSNGLMFTADGGTAHMAILNSGNVGIGTTTPGYKLDVNGNVKIEPSSNSLLYIDRTNTSSYGRLMFDTGGVDKWSIGQRADSPGTSLTFYDETTGPVMTMAVGGNVGIGTTTPNARLHVAGSGFNGTALADYGGYGSALFLDQTSSVTTNSGGMLLLGAEGLVQGGIKALLRGGGTHDIGDLAFLTRNSSSDAALSERMRITYDGNVGIGTTSPSSLLAISGNAANLTINDTATAPKLTLWDGQEGLGYTMQRTGDGYLTTNGTQSTFSGYAWQTNNGTTQMTLTNGGNLGIGTANPFGRLHVYVSGTAMADADSNNQVIIEGANKAITDQTANLFLVANDTAASDMGGSIAFGAKYSGNNVASLAKIHAIKSGSFGGGLQFATRVDGGSMTERMRINASGNVGIGTTSPLRTLSVYSNQNATDKTGAVAVFGDTTNNKTYAYISPSQSKNSVTIAGVLSGQSNTTKLLLNPAGGNVGIATTSPGSLFTIYTNANSTDESGGFALGNTTVGSTYLYAGANQSNGYSYLGSVRSGQAYNNLILAPNGGNVGIGTTTPTQLLEVGAGTGVPTIRINGASTGSALGASLDFAYNSVNTSAIGGYSGIIGGAYNNDLTLYGGATTHQDMHFFPGGSETLTLKSSGNVGIGTTTPGILLDVGSGTGANFIRVSGAGSGSNAGAGLIFARGGNEGISIGNASAILGGTYSDDLLFYDGVGGASQRFYTSAAERMRIDSSGSVGINRTDPSNLVGSTAGGLVAQDGGRASTTAQVMFTDQWGGANYTLRPDGTSIWGGTGGEHMRLTAAGNLGIGNTGPGSKLVIDSLASSVELAALEDTDTGAGSDVAIRFRRNGSTVGTVTETNTATAYNTSSDRRIKENIATTTLGLDTLLALPVRDFSFKSDATHATTTGFIAQELESVFPWAVTTNGDNGSVPLGATSTPWSVDYGRITPLIVKAVQDIANLADAFKTKLTAWFADASNGITDLFVKVGHFNKVCAKNSDGSETCVTGDQMKSMLAGSAAAGAPNNGSQSGVPASVSANFGGDAGSSTTTAPVVNNPPTLIVNGNSPAQWPLNQIWNDNLGALFTHNGIAETVYSTSTIDTTVAGTSTVNYWATIPTSGAILHATRAVVVAGAANDNQASSTPSAANDNAPLTPLSATGTEATTSASSTAQ